MLSRANNHPENCPDYPWREPASPWHGLVAEILLQRTRAGNVVPVYRSFLEAFPTPQALAQASVQDIERLIYPLGLRWRAPLLKRLGERLAELNGRLPETLKELTGLPGVGPYVASAWLSFHGSRRSVIVDANVVRWLCRLVGMPYDGETRREKWLLQLADRFTPRHNWKAYNYAALDFAREVCAPRPRCEMCPIGPKLCAYGRARLSGSAGLPLHRSKRLNGDPPASSPTL